MFGIVIGTVCLIALVKMVRRGRRHREWGYGYGGGCGGSRGYGGGCGSHNYHGHHGPHGQQGPHYGGYQGGYQGSDDQHFSGFGPGFFRGGPFQWGLRRFFSHLETTPAQEKVILDAVKEAEEEARKSFNHVQQSREDISRAVRGSVFDEGSLGNAFARHDETIAAVRKAITGLLIKTHEVLDERQRTLLAELIDRTGGFRSWWGSAPYRA